MEQQINTILFILILYSTFILRGIYAHRKANRVIATWAQQNGYIILEKKYLPHRTGPFWATDSQCIFNVLVDDHGRQRSCWLRVGNWLWGMVKEEIAVNWDKK
jgi:hypothetical protein